MPLIRMNEEGVYESGPVVQQPARPDDHSEADDEDEMVATERELAEDAQWKKIQQNTFTRWANEHLKTVEKHIGNLETDLSDGLRLITLIEVLSGRRLPKHNKRPAFRSQKLENVSVALKFLQDDEGIRIVNIGESSFKFKDALKPVSSSLAYVSGIAVIKNPLHQIGKSPFCTKPHQRVNLIDFLIVNAQSYDLRCLFNVPILLLQFTCGNKRAV